MGLETIVCEPETKDLDLVQKLVKECGIKAVHNHPAPSKYWDPNVALAAFKDRDRAWVLRGHRPLDAVNVEPLKALQILNGKIVSFHFKDLNHMAKTGHVVWGTGKGDTKVLLRQAEETRFEAVVRLNTNTTGKLRSQNGPCVAAKWPPNCRNNCSFFAVSYL